MIFYQQVIHKDKKLFYYWAGFDWSRSGKNQFLFKKTMKMWNVPIDNTPYSINLNLNKHKLFDGMERHLNSQNLKMAVVIVATEKLAKAFSLDSKSKFNSMG